MNEEHELLKLEEIYDAGFISEPEYLQRKELVKQRAAAVREESKKRKREQTEAVTSPYFKRVRSYTEASSTQTQTTTKTFRLPTEPKQNVARSEIEFQPTQFKGPRTITNKFLKASPTPVPQITQSLLQTPVVRARKEVDQEAPKYPPSQKLTSKNGLPDYLREGLKLVIVGDNPGIQSAREASWYAHNTNQFWTLLHESGLTKAKLTPTLDYKILEEGIGLTCLHSGSTRGVDDVATEDWIKGYEILKAKLIKYKPRYVCFNGKGIYTTITGKKGCENGIQEPLKIGDMKFQCFVMPSSSARVKAYSLADKIAILKILAALVNRKTE